MSTKPSTDQQSQGSLQPDCSAADTITAEVMRVVSPEGYDTEEWEQVKAAVIKGIESVQKPPNDKLRHGGENQ